MIVVVAGVVEVDEPTVILPTVEPARGFGINLTGVDGSTWDLNSDQVAALAGIIGVGDSRPEHRWSGKVWRDLDYPLQRFELPVLLQHETSLGFRDLDAAWSDATAPEGECILTITAPDSRWRQRRLRREETPDSEGYDLDPLLARRAEYKMTFVASPFWEGPTIRQPFLAVEAAAMYPIAPLTVTAADTTANARMTNPGHVPAWPLYVATGPVSGFTVGVGDSLVEYGPVAAGQSRYIDTHPDRQTVGINRGGNSETAWLGVLDRDFAPIPPAEQVPLQLELLDAGAGASLNVELVPSYRRAA